MNNIRKGHSSPGIYHVETTKYVKQSFPPRMLSSHTHTKQSSKPQGGGGGGVVPPTPPVLEPQYRAISGETYCDGFDKYVDVYSQVSYDNGRTWETTVTTPTLIEKDSEDCGYVDPFNGHEYVDLGLPSGILWATMNVGANSPTDAGLYFAWGDTNGYAASQVGSGEGLKYFGWEDYKWSIDGSSRNLEKYGIGKLMELALEDDAAHINMGGAWLLPTQTQSNELIDNTTSASTRINGVKCVILTSNINGNSIIFPMVGGCQNGIVGSVGQNGSCWNNTILWGSEYCGKQLSLTYGYDVSSDTFTPICVGRTIRGVIQL